MLKTGKYMHHGKTKRKYLPYSWEVKLSQSEEENKNYEMLECNDEYLKVILERQEQERQELYRRHQQELQSYKMHHLRRIMEESVVSIAKVRK
ncbi:hypothetical protein CEXT_448971 [Caerostris extrusa]|uniref:Uncharacterized protein n=1 Tax=Caerostris extrusa TaxID=172846 RepID=A0AAV4TYC2_CAEEX|nr:hypothetical protein CEXT_448971 [Caerostris extrusa]